MQNISVNSSGDNLGRFRRQRTQALVIAKHELERIKDHARWQAKQVEDSVLRVAQLEQMKTASKNIVKNWKNTVLNKQRERVARRLKRIQDEEDRRNAIFEVSQKEAAEERKKRIAEAKRLILFGRDDIGQINNAFVFSEVLREREKQIEFNNRLKDEEKKRKDEEAAQIKLDIEVYHDQEKENKVTRREEMLKRNQENIQMIKEKASREATLYAGEKDQEKQDLIDLQIEKEKIEENIKQEVDRKKKLVRKDAEDSLKMKAAADEARRLEDEDEDKVIDVYLKVKHRIECLRELKETEARKTKWEHQERIRGIIAESLKVKQSDEDGMIAKALAERDEREAEKIRKREEYEEKLLKERKAYFIEFEENKKREQEKLKHLHKWNLAQRMKRSEIDKMEIIRRKTVSWDKKMVVRDGYNQQIQEHKETKCEEQEEDMMYHNALVRKIQGDESDFLKYADEVVEECKQAGRPLYPINKVIQQYRKKNGIILREKLEKELRAMVEHDQRNQELEEETEKQFQLVCKPNIPDLKLCSPYCRKVPF